MRKPALVGILMVAAAARLWYLGAGLPHAVGIDEGGFDFGAAEIDGEGEGCAHPSRVGEMLVAHMSKRRASVDRVRTAS